MAGNGMTIEVADLGRLVADDLELGNRVSLTRDREKR